MFSSRTVFLLGTLLAIVATGDAAATTCTGASGKFNTENNPGGTGVVACKCVVGYTAASDAIVIGDITLDCTKCAAGYYLSAGTATVNAVCTQAPANKYHPGLNDLSSGFTAETATACPTNTESVAGSAALTDCKVTAGYYLKQFVIPTSDVTIGSGAETIGFTAHGLIDTDQVTYNNGGGTSLAGLVHGTTYFVVNKATSTFKVAATSGGTAIDLTGTGNNAQFFNNVLIATANYYAAGGVSVNEATAATVTASRTACPYAGTTPATGKSALTDCVPDCGTKIVIPTSGVTIGSEVIAFAAHGLDNGDQVTYNNGGGTALAGLVHGTTYFVVSKNTGDFKVAAISGGTAIDLTGTGNNAQFFESSSLIGTLVQAGTCVCAAGYFGKPVNANPFLITGAATQGCKRAGGFDIPVAAVEIAAETIKFAAHGLSITASESVFIIPTASVEVGAETIKVAGHGLSVNDKVTYNHGGGTPITGLSGGTTYFVVDAKFVFATSAVTSGTDIFAFAAHGLSDGDKVTYNNGGGTAITGLVHGTTYFVVNKNTGDFKVEASIGGGAIDISSDGNNAQFFTTNTNYFSVSASAGGAAVDISAAGNAAQSFDVVGRAGKLKVHEKVTYNHGGGTPITGLTGGTTYFVVDAKFVFATSAVTSGTDIFAFAAHGLSDGDKVTYNNGGAAAITGLVHGTTYFVVNKNTGDFKVEASIGGGAIDISSDGNNAQFFTTNTNYFSVSASAGGAAVAISGAGTDAQSFDLAGKAFIIGTSDVTVATDTITSTAHGLLDGNQVTYNNGGGGAITGLVHTTTYYVVSKTTDTFKVAASAGGAAIGLSGTGTDAQFFTTVGTYGNVAVAGAACPTSSAVTTVATDADGITVLADCKVDSHFYIKTESDTTTDATNLVVSVAPLNYYASGGASASEQLNSAVTATMTACPFAGTTARSLTIPIASVSTSANTITSTAHGLLDGDQVTYNQISGGNVITGLAADTTYYVVSKTADTFKVAATAGGAAIGLTGTGHADQTFSPVGKTLVTQCTPGATITIPLASVTTSANTITSIAHGLLNGDQVTYNQISGGSVITGLAADTTYYVVSKTADNFKVAALSTPSTAIGLSGTGHAAQTFTIPSAGDCGAATLNIEKNAGTCRCKANFYGAPKDAGNVELAVATQGCNACPFGGTANAGSSAVTDCTPAAAATSVNVVSVGGTSVCAANYYGAPTSTTSGAVATGGCTACPTNSESTAGGAANLAACTVKAGFYISTESATTSSATGLVISAVPANFYGVGGASASEQTDATVTATKVACPFGGVSLAGAGFIEDCAPACGATTVNAVSARGTCICASNYYGTPTSTTAGAVATGGCTACPTNSESVAATATLAACTVKAGYYIAVESTSVSDATSLSILIAPVNWYAPGGASASEQVDGTVAATRLACPHAGTTPATGKTALSDCVPDCATANSVGLGGTCVCKSTHYGAPTPTNAAVTAGCTACPTGKYVQTAYTAATGGSASSGVSAASTGVADCDVQPGFYISTQSTSTSNIASLAVTQILANRYAPGKSGTVQDNAAAISAAAALVCPFAGTTAQAGNALAGCTPSCGTGTNAVAVGGTCRCASTHYGAPKDANSAELAIVTKGCTACPANSATAYTASAALTGLLADCEVNAGYYLSVAGSTGTAGTITQTPANKYQAGSATAVDSTTVDSPTACVVKSTSAAGSDTIDDCKVSPGNYLSVASPSATSSGRIAISESGFYAAGGSSISTITAETPSACTYGGTSPIGSVITACSPSCGTVAVAGSGTCTCKAGRTGTPTPTNAAVTGGCTATLCLVNKYVNSNVCTACAAGTTIAKDGDASGANTACAKTKCAVNEYVKINVCTACAAGTTIAKDGDASGANTACAKTKCAVNENVKSNVCTACVVGTTNVIGDDASGADTTCDADAVSSASRSDISFATIVVVVATLLACVAL